MKPVLPSVALAFAMIGSLNAADVSVKLTGVHLCCQNCVKGVEAAVGKVEGVTASSDRDAATVTLTGSDKAVVQKAADALVAAGYYGKSSDPDIKLKADTGAKGQKVQELKVDGVHLCCGKCVNAVNDALGSVEGVKANTAVKGAKSFAVTGEFDDKDVFTALQKAGLTGRVGK